MISEEKSKFARKKAMKTSYKIILRNCVVIIVYNEIDLRT